MEVEQDLIYAVTNYGPYLFSGIIFHYKVISSNELELLQYISEVLPPKKAAVVLIEIMSENVKDPVKYEALLICLEKKSSLNYLYKKIIILG